MRGQSAIEYLMTYGWALVVLGVILVLIYSSGIFSPTYLISEECNLGPKLPCNFIISLGPTDTVLTAEIENGFGYTIYINEVTMRIENQGDMENDGNPARKLESGDKLKIRTFLPGKRLSAGSTQYIKVNIEYYSCAPEVNEPCTLPENELALHTISGRIIGKVNAG